MGERLGSRTNEGGCLCLVGGGGSCSYGEKPKDPGIHGGRPRRNRNLRRRPTTSRSPPAAPQKTSTPADLGVQLLPLSFGLPGAPPTAPLFVEFRPEFTKGGARKERPGRTLQTAAGDGRAATILASDGGGRRVRASRWKNRDPPARGHDPAGAQRSGEASRLESSSAGLSLRSRAPRGPVPASPSSRDALHPEPKKGEDPRREAEGGEGDSQVNAPASELRRGVSAALGL